MNCCSSLTTTLIYDTILNDTLKVFGNFEKKEKKSLWCNVFWYTKVWMFWKCIQYTIHWDKTQMLNKFPLGKKNVTKNALFFLTRIPTHDSFIFNLRFLYELKHKVRLSKTVCGIFYFQFVSFSLKFIFLFNKMHRLFDFKSS